MKALLPALLLFAALSADALRAQPSDAYLDEQARELVRGARARRGTVDLSIDEYGATSADRFSVTHRVLGRERLLFRRETATRVRWRRNGPIDMEVIGAREGSGFTGDSVTVPGDLDDFFHLAFDPLDSEFLFRLDTTSIRHPFAAGGEEHYRFATGDSASIRLPDGWAVNLRELRVIPRRSEPQLMTGSFWLHTETHAVVQAAFRPASVYRMSMSRSGTNASVTVGSTQDAADVPFLLRSIRGEITEITVDYGFWDLRWWLPRYVKVAGALQAGALGTLTLQYELRYGEYDVHADTTRGRIALADADLPCRGVRRVREVTVLAGPDSVSAEWNRKADARRDARATEPDTAAERCARHFRVTAPESREALLESESLPPSFYGPSELISDLDAENLAARLARVPLPALRLGRSVFDWGVNSPGMLRYNRIEALSIGARAAVGLGRGELGAELRYGIADEQPKGLTWLQLEGRSNAVKLSGYRELRAFDAERNPHTFARSLAALLVGQDDELFYRAAGASLEFTPRPLLERTYSLRLYAEHQADVRKNTDVSLPHLFDGDFRFRSNVPADRARQYGAELMVQRDFGMNPDAFRLGARAGVRAETGTYEFLRPELALRLNTPSLGPLAFALEGAAGTAVGDVPMQSLWYLGGARTLRGYHLGDVTGPAYWRARAEVGSSFPGARVTLFSDAAWAGPATNEAWRASRPLRSVGAGLSLGDGLLRLDLARALDEPVGWRVHFYIGGIQ